MAEGSFLRALGGFGAGYTGQGDEYLANIQARQANKAALEQQQEQLSEGRKAALVKDAYGALNLLNSGKNSAALDLINNRLDSIKKLGGDPSHTQEIRDMLISGDPEKIADAKSQLQQVVDVGKASGYLQSPEDSLEYKKFGFEQDKFSKEQALKQAEFDWKKAHPNAGAAGDASTAHAKDLAIYEDMVRKGNPNAERFAYMVGLSGRDVESKVDLASREATASTTGKAQAERRDLFKTQGLAAAENLPTLNRAIELQKQISTGGVAKNLKGLQNFLGTASADEGELNSLFAQNILGQLKSTFGGNPTEGEREALAEAQSSFSQTGRINERLLNNALKLANERVSRGKRAAQADKDDGTLAEFESLGRLSYGDKPTAKKTGGVLHVDAQGNKAMVYPDGSYEEVN